MNTTCKRCSLSHFRRLKRHGLIQALLSKLGYYPWECSSCGDKVYLRKRGEKRRRSIKDAVVH